MKEKQLLSLTALLLVALLSLQLAGCAALAPSAEAANLMENVTPNRGEATPVRQEDAAAATDFSLRLFRAGNEAGKNTLISPLSVLIALAITANGAGGETLAQMERTLGMDAERLNSFVRSELDFLSEDDCLRLANAIWLKDDPHFTVERDFLQTNADYYGVDLYKLPFNKEALKKINDWVKEKTNGRISEIIEQIPEDAVMYLANALSFDAKWEDPYEDMDVSDGDFTLENGETREVKYMYSTEGYYLENEKAVGFLKPYEGGRYAFVGLLPREGLGLKDYVDSLTGAELQSLLAGRTKRKVLASLPKFKVAYDAGLSGALRSMGMELPFDRDEADFSGLGTVSGGQVWIDELLHKSFISVNKQGTKAASLTMTQLKATFASVGDAMEEVPRVYLNRPFVYLLIDARTNLPCYIGTMLNPAE